MKDIVLAGIQWSGKGTQCQLILNHFGKDLSYFEAGGILRALQAKPNAIGEYVSSTVNSGGLLPDQFMVKVFDLFLFCLEEGKNILADGFPRQLPQMEGFLQRMQEYKREFVVIVLDITRDEAVKRLTGRRMCKSCGAILSIHLHDCAHCPDCGSEETYQRVDDQDLAAINTRIDLFHEQTLPVITHLDSLGLVKHINGDQPIEKVFQDILAVL